jgi:Domain of unknown function (DUF397)
MPPTGDGFGGLSWRKARRSVNNGECVELATTSGKVVIRDSKDPAGPVLMHSPSEWQEFLAHVKRGSFEVR